MSHREEASRGRPRTRWRNYVSRLAWERLGVPPEELEEVSGGRRSGEGTGRRWPRLPIDQQLLGFSCWAGRLGRRQQLGWGEGKSSGPEAGTRRFGGARSRSLQAVTGSGVEARVWAMLKARHDTMQRQPVDKEASLWDSNEGGRRGAAHRKDEGGARNCM
ncbi:hypothetical protein L3Q82_001819 [Scortum barcoo]|uniref:Uncharacterized protein n=1 Tax=Scortum barcoo TaxID=214431 RepID=A0ACB8W7K6_9TELE|nr:hypothetical protein L3Q82_001819 [Scortum barcoo]